MLLFSGDSVLWDFTKSNGLDNWYVVDDRVMGGVSQGKLTINEEGHAVFSGDVSLDNNGGFSSLRHRLTKKDISSYKSVKLRVKGDGKQYQFRVKSNRFQRQDYITNFVTNGEWQTIVIPFEDLYPSFRGRRLNMPNFSGQSLEEIAILIANNKPESFELMIDKITLD